MKAVILAGGRGERLRPITDTRPKPLVPVLARPVMDYCLSLLAHHGVEEAFVTTHYLASQIRERYGDEAFGVRLTYSLEKVPLGTAGGVKLLEDKLRDEELFLVMSGDALCDFDLRSAVRFHREKKSDATVILSSVKTPLEYGVVLSDRFRRIFAFSEKPDWSEAFSDLVNTGVYILSPNVLRLVPEGKPFDFSRDLFPLMLRGNGALYGYKEKGYWCDIGRIATLYRCNRDLLSGKVKTYLPPVGETRESHGEKSFIAHSARVSDKARVGGGSIIGEGAVLEEDSVVQGTLVMEEAAVGRGALARDAVLCEKSRLEARASAMPGSVLGASSTVFEGGVLPPDTKTAPFAELGGREVFEEEDLIFTEWGIGMGDRTGLSHEYAERLGFAMARTFSGAVGVFHGEKETTPRFAALFAAGVLRGGGTAELFGGADLASASFGARLHAIPSVFLTERGGKGVFYALEADGFPLTRAHALSLERAVRETGKSYPAGQILSRPSVREDYVSALSREMGEGKGRTVFFGGRLGELLREAAIKAGFTAYDEKDGALHFSVFPRQVKLYLDGERLCDTEKLRLFVLERELEQGRRRFFLPDSVPALFAEHIRSRGGTAEFFSLAHTAKDETDKRREGGETRYLFDTAYLAARAVREMKEMTKEALKSALRATPDVYVSELKCYPSLEHKAALLGRLSQLPPTVGVRLAPGFFSLRIVSSAQRFETALDNAMEFRGKINEIEKEIRGK